jgi:hypothetical protein
MNLINLLLSEFDADFSVLHNLSVDSQIKIYRMLKPEIDSFFAQFEKLNDNEKLTTALLTNLSQRAKEKRNQAVRQGALDKTNINWLSAALLEHLYNSILSGDNSAIQHIGGSINGWMQGMDMIDLG